MLTSDNIHHRLPFPIGGGETIRGVREMKILNLYAGVGGNRTYWSDHEVTAVDNSKKVCSVYKERFYEDEVVHSDAKEFLERHYDEFDFIWASPPCVSHTQLARFHRPRLPDFELYEIIIFLREHYCGLWCVENVKPYYKQLIPAEERGRHLLWLNYWLPEFNVPEIPFTDDLERYEEYYQFALPEKWTHKQKRTAYRNLTHPRIGLEVIYEAEKNYALKRANEHIDEQCRLFFEHS